MLKPPVRRTESVVLLMHALYLSSLISLNWVSRRRSLAPQVWGTVVISYAYVLNCTFINSRDRLLTDAYRNTTGDFSRETLSPAQ